MAVPNMYATVVECANRWPREFREAHTDSLNKHLWIKLLAFELHKLDERWGLNGKRGNPNDLSMDAVNWLGEGVGFDPTRGDRPVTVIDVIAGAGGTNPTPAWQVFNDPNKDRGPGAWVKPLPVAGYQDGPGGTPPPPPVEPPPVETTEIVNVLTQISQKLNEVIASHERVVKAVETKIGASIDATNGLAEELKISRHYQLESNAALKASIDALVNRFDRGFVLKAKGGWGIGNIDGTLTVREQG